MQHLKARFESKIEKVTESGCWIWIACINSDGYGSIRIDGKTKGAHRVSYELYKSKIPSGLYVCHSCDVRACVNPDHLFLGTHQDNMTDRNNKGRTNRPKGEKNASAKLSEQQVKEIKNDPRASRRLGEIYGVSKTQILRIKNSNSWECVK